MHLGASRLYRARPEKSAPVETIPMTGLRTFPVGNERGERSVKWRIQLGEKGGGFEVAHAPDMKQLGEIMKAESVAVVFPFVG